MSAPTQFTQSHATDQDGTINFQCSTDQARWPWLALPPSHPIVVQTMNYWVSVETAVARGTYDGTKWSALTHCQWHIDNPHSTNVVRGTCNNSEDQGKLGYHLHFFDAKDASVFHIQGTGVVFQTRDFEGWRQQAKQAMPPPANPQTFSYAATDAVGVAPPAHSFISPITEGDEPTAFGLVTLNNGFPPANPYLSGSGDHVNAPHLAEAARQFICLVTGNPNLTCTHGDMALNRFVEIDQPFRLDLLEHDPTAKFTRVSIAQADRQCTTVSLTYR